MSVEDYARKIIKEGLHDFVVYLLERNINFFDRNHKSLDEEELDKLINQFLDAR